MPDCAQCFEILIEGHLDECWSEWFGGLAVLATSNGSTLLTGTIRDQAELYGILTKIRDLGLILVSLQRSDLCK
jgi:hypothetical protein